MVQVFIKLLQIVLDDMDEDEDEEDANCSNFYDDMYKLDLATFKWHTVNLRKRQETGAKKNKPVDSEKNNETIEDIADDNNNNSSSDEQDDALDMADLEKETDQVMETLNDSKEKADPVSPKSVAICRPSPRRSSYMQFHKGVVYLYGGKFEDKGDKEVTFNDMYCLNAKKMDEWQLMFEDKEMSKLMATKSKKKLTLQKSNISIIGNLQKRVKIRRRGSRERFG